MAYPTFLIIGAMKGGTSSLYQYLRSHPDVFMPQVKELDFFSIERFWRRGWDWYAEQFESATNGQAIGEASTSYTKFPYIKGVPERIAGRLPQVRLIYVIRDPIARIRSHYEHEVALGREKLSLEDTVVKDSRYVDFSRYALQIEQYLAHFRRDQLLVLLSERLRHQREETLDRVFRFIGVKPGLPVSVLDTEYYTTEARRSYPAPFASALRLLMRRSPAGATRLASLTPSVIKKFLGRPVREITTARSQLSEDRIAIIRRLLRDDVERLQTYVDDDFDGWGLL